MSNAEKTNEKLYQSEYIGSGTFIISKEGRIELPYYYDNIADHPPLDLLLNGVLTSRWDQEFEGPVGPGGNEPSDLGGLK